MQQQRTLLHTATGVPSPHVLTSANQTCQDGSGRTCVNTRTRPSTAPQTADKGLVGSSAESECLVHGQVDIWTSKCITAQPKGVVTGPTASAVSRNEVAEASRHASPNGKQSKSSNGVSVQRRRLSSIDEKDIVQLVGEVDGGRLSAQEAHQALLKAAGGDQCPLVSLLARRSLP